MRERSRAQGYDWRAIGENIAEGQTTVREVMQTWMDSPGHRDNILRDHTHLGVGFVAGGRGPCIASLSIAETWSATTRISSVAEASANMKARVSASVR